MRIIYGEAEDDNKYIQGTASSMEDVRSDE